MTPLTSGRLDGLNIDPIVDHRTGELRVLELRVASLPGLAVQLEADAGRELHHALGVVLAGGKRAGGRMLVYAKLAPGPQPTGLPPELMLVELPPNCSIDGDHGEMRKMIADLVEIVFNLEPDGATSVQLERASEIAAWLAGNQL